MIDFEDFSKMMKANIENGDLLSNLEQKESVQSVVSSS